MVTVAEYTELLKVLTEIIHTPGESEDSIKYHQGLRSGVYHKLLDKIGVVYNRECDKVYI